MTVCALTGLVVCRTWSFRKFDLYISPLADTSILLRISYGRWHRLHLPQPLCQSNNIIIISLNALRRGCIGSRATSSSLVHSTSNSTVLLNSAHRRASNLECR